MTPNFTLDAQFWAWWFSLTQDQRDYLDESVCYCGAVGDDEPCLCLECVNYA